MKSAAYLQVETKKRPQTRGVYERTAGSGVWWIHWYDAQGRRHREKVGTKGAAIDLYRKRKTQVLEGRKLPERLRRAPVQFREIAQVALQYSSLHKRSFRDDRCRMAKLLQWFSDRAAESITAQEIEELLNNERWRPATTNRYRSLLSLVYRLAIRDGKVKDNPARLVRHRPEVNGRVRFLSREEENQIRAAILELFPEHLAEFELALHSGLRRGEQYHAQWQNVDFERRVLTVPLDKSGRTSHVPLNAGALHSLAELHNRTGDSDLVCGGARSSRSWFERALGNGHPRSSLARSPTYFRVALSDEWGGPTHRGRTPARQLLGYGDALRPPRTRSSHGCCRANGGRLLNRINSHQNSHRSNKRSKR